MHRLSDVSDELFYTHRTKCKKKKFGGFKAVIICMKATVQ